MNNKNYSRLKFLPCLSAILLAGVPSSKAALLVYEGFDYTAGTAINSAAGNGGTGWLLGSSWSTGGTITATSPGLTNAAIPDNTATSLKASLAGGSANAFSFRQAATSFGADNTTLWVSFIGQRTGNPDGSGSFVRVFALSFFNGGTGTANEMFSVGDLTNAVDFWSLNPDAVNTNAHPTTVPINTQAYLLLKITYGVGGADTGELWANPDLSGGEGGLAAQTHATINDDMSFDRLRMSAGNSSGGNASTGDLDEIRIGDTFADVAPSAVPEPTVAVIGGLGLLGLLSRRRCRS